MSSPLKPLLVVKTGSAPPELVRRRGDYEAWIGERLGPGVPDRIVCPVAEGAELPDPGSVCGVVVTGSSAMVSSREPWSERTGAWLAGALGAGTPILGICYGHQLLAQVLGGRVGPNPRGREMGSIQVHRVPGCEDDPLLGGLPSLLEVQATHLESVLELPPRARLLASSEGDPHQAFAVGRKAWGVQFHPEFDADAIRHYLEMRRERLQAEGLDADALLARVRDSSHGRALLRRFAELLRP